MKNSTHKRSRHRGITHIKPIKINKSQVVSNSPQLVWRFVKPETQRNRRRTIHTGLIVRSKLSSAYSYSYIYVELTYHVDADVDVEEKIQYRTGFLHK